MVNHKKNKERRARRRWDRLPALGSLLTMWLVSAATACVTVRPTERAVLADPTMQYEGGTLEEAARQHVLENREGSYGGGSVRGGGCGCN
jgi:hypothetical protein